MPKIKIFSWRMLKNLLPTGAELLKWKLDLISICKRCGDSFETLEHVFRDCEWSRRFWYTSCLRIMISDQDVQVSLSDWFYKIKSILPLEAISVFLSIVWFIWYAKNYFIFKRILINGIFYLMATWLHFKKLVVMTLNCYDNIDCNNWLTDFYDHVHKWQFFVIRSLYKWQWLWLYYV